MDVSVSTDVSVSAKEMTSSRMTDEELLRMLHPSFLRKIILEMTHYKFLSRRVFDPTTEDVLTGVFTVIGVTGFLFNLLIIIKILRSASLKFFPYHCLLINLFASNIILCIFCVPFNLASLLSVTWNYGQTWCQLIPAIQGIGVCVNSFSITAAAIDRFIEVKTCRRPNVGVYYSTFRRVLVSTIIIWVFGVTFGSPHALYKVVKAYPFTFTIHPSNNSVTMDPKTFFVCTSDWDAITRGVYSLIILLFEMLIPSLTLIITSIYIRRQVSVSTNAHQNGDANNINVPLDANYAIRDESITMTLVSVTLSFIICWTPISLFNVLLDLRLINFKGDDEDLLSGSNNTLYLLIAILHSISLASSPLNPLIYGLCTPSIRRELFFWRKRRTPTSLHQQELQMMIMD